MTRSRLVILFSIAALVSMAAFTAVTYHSHVEVINLQNLSYIHLYVEQLNEKRQNGVQTNQIMLPYHLINNNTYQIIVYKEKVEPEYWLKPQKTFAPTVKLFPLEAINKQNQPQGNIDIQGKNIHWIKLPLHHPDSNIFFIHMERDHWRNFHKYFGLPIIIFGTALLWVAIWTAIILSNLFKRVHSKNKLLQSQAIEIGQARDEAYAAVRSKNQFLANMNHELRTPLTAIIGFSENMLDSDDASNPYIKPLQTIVRNGHHLLHIINELLDMSKIEANKLQVEHVNFSVVSLIQDVESLMSPQAKDKGLEFKVNYSWPLPVTINNDPFRIKQVLLNLCSNAIKFTHHGYVHINVHCQRNNELVCFELIDTGIGIVHKQHKKIFLAFDQADASITRQYGGTGLGLSLSKRLTELMKGTIELSSEPNKGSCFAVTLPTGSLSDVEFISELGKHKFTSTIENKPIYTRLKGHVLVADDAQDNRLLMSALLAKFGLQTTIVENGQQALDELARKEFDLILLDIQMPVLDGMQTIKKLQEQGYSKPVIALTANTMNEDRRIYREAGFTDFIAKPVRFQMINKILSNYLGKA